MWIGLSDIEHEGRFTWEVDNSTLNFTNWEPGQPNNGGNGRQHCVTVGAKEYFGLWNDDYCPYPYLYICEKPLNGMCKLKFPVQIKFQKSKAKQNVNKKLGKCQKQNIHRTSVQLNKLHWRLGFFLLDWCMLVFPSFDDGVNSLCRKRKELCSNSERIRLFH